MKKNKSTQYANVPMYIIFKGSKGFNTHTGQWLSPQQLASYTSPKEVIIKENKQHIPHWSENYYGN